jgi:hypothetical protein
MARDRSGEMLDDFEEDVKPDYNRYDSDNEDPKVGLAKVALEDKIVTSQLNALNEPWIKTYWRPAMAWLYMLICFMDFVGFPIITMVLPVVFNMFGITTFTYKPWMPISLTNGGIIHLSFGAILGVSAWSRGKEKLASMRDR